MAGCKKGKADMLKVDISKLEGFVSEKDITEMYREVSAAHMKLLDSNAPGAEFTGWIDLPRNYDKAEFLKIEAAAKKIRNDSQVLIVIGVGGSYLGAHAALEIFKPQGIEIYFSGNSLSPNAIKNTVAAIGDRDFSINVISKSGGTMEPAIAFRIFRDLLVEKYGDAADERIYVTTDRKNGALKALADKNGWQTFTVPEDIGGRYSVLTAVGLLPIAAGGADIRCLLEGAAEACEKFAVKDEFNPVWQYVAVRNLLYRAGKKIEIYANYEPSYVCFSEWLKQLFGESEGKGHGGIFPANVCFTADLHSIGQYIQDGERNLFETVIYVDDTGADIEVPWNKDDGDDLNRLAGKPLSFIREKAFEATLMAHFSGGTPSVVIRMPSMTEKTLGELFYFFELACGISGHLLGVNPFDQPGVEAYKKNMYALLGK